MILSKHSKIRMRERTPYNHKERQNLFKNALLKGQSAQDIKDKKLKQYICERQGKCKIKLYKGYLFIYNKNSKKLYTMYKLPKELSEESEKN